MQPQQLLATRVVMPPQRCFPRYFSGNISPGFRTSVVMLQGKGVTERTDLPRLQRRSVLFFFFFFFSFSFLVSRVCSRAQHWTPYRQFGKWW